MLKRIVSALLIFAMVVCMLPPVTMVQAATVVDSEWCGENVRWILTSDGVLTFRGTGTFESSFMDFSTEILSLQGKDDLQNPDNEMIGIEREAAVKRHIFTYRFWEANVKKLVLEEGLTEIPYYMFETNSYTEGSWIGTLSGTLVIPNSVKSIEHAAFTGFRKITTLKIGSGVEYISSGNFEGFDSLKNVYYEGTKEQWEKLATTLDKDVFRNVNFVFLGEEENNTDYEIFISCDGTMIVGEKEKIAVTTDPAGIKNLKLAWKSSDPGVATVDQNGVVTANSIGCTNISATTKNGKVAEYSLQISDNNNALKPFKQVAYGHGVDNFYAKIPYKIFKDLYSDPTIAALKYALIKAYKEDGVCAGIVGSAMMFANGYRDSRDYGASSVRTLKRTNALDELIYYNYALQKHDAFMKEEKRNQTYHNPAKLGKNNSAVIQRLADLAQREFVYIGVRHKEDGEENCHALMAYGMDPDSVFDGRPCSKVLLYDPNEPGKNGIYLVLFRDLDGAYTGEWKTIDASLSNFSEYNSDQKDARLSFVDYDTLIAVAEKGNIAAYSLRQNPAEITLLQNGKTISLYNSDEMCFKAVDGLEQSNTIANVEYFDNLYYEDCINQVVILDDIYTITGSNENGTVETTAYSSSDAFTAVTANDAEVTFNLRDAATETVEGDNFVNIDNQGVSSDYVITYMPFED